MKWTWFFLMEIVCLGTAHFGSADDTRVLIEPGKTDLAANEIRLLNQGCHSQQQTVNGTGFYSVRTNNTYAWPSVVFIGQWNLDAFTEIVADVENTDKDRELNISLRVDDVNTKTSQYWLTKNDTLTPGQRKTIALTFPRADPSYIRRKIFGMRGSPGNIPADFKLPNKIDMPCIIGEFHFGALDRGMFHTGLKATKDQNDRDQKYNDYVRGALGHPLWIGTHWFQYQDQPLTGRTDGENYQIGLIDICDTPYPDTIAVLRDIGKDMYDLRMSK